MSQSTLLTVTILLQLSLIILGVDERKFPDYFTFGVATASYQVEGAWNEDGKGESIWDHLIHERPDLVTDGSNGDIACDSYHKYETDVALLKDLGVNFYRFSLSWTRILPYGYIDRGINDAGVDYYDNLINLLVENGIEPMVTLYHWDLPQTLQEDLGGWLNESMVNIFANYATLAFDLYGDRVKTWATFNEPYTFCLQGYETGRKAPAITDNPGVDAYKCGHVVLKSHAAAYRIYDQQYRATQNGKISLVLNTNWVESISADVKDFESAERTLQFQFGWFANPIVHGNYPQVMIDRIADRSAKEGFAESRLPEFTAEEIANINGTYDYIGVNHYTTTMSVWMDDVEIGEPSFIKDVSTNTYFETTWEGSASYWLKVVPWGIRRMTQWVKKTYKNPEIIYTENGYSDIEEILDDETRINYMTEYLSLLLESIHNNEGNVTGYTAWSLMDNFEWLSGYSEKFGLYSVNFSDPEYTRTPKNSVNFYKKVIETKCLIDECIG